MNLSKNEKNTLLNIAEWAIHHYVGNKERSFERSKFEITANLAQKLGAFVSVYIDNDLRGCMGTFSESEELAVNVHQMAIQAATADRRFKPVMEKDLDQLTTEISVLSRRERISSPEEIIIGKHGVYLINGYRRATLLPQVAVKHNMNQIDFLECCARNKLGLSKDAWKEAEIYVYEAIVFT